MNEFQIKPTIQFGSNALNKLSSITGQRVLLITDQAMVNFGIVDMVTKHLQMDCMAIDIFADVTPDPDVSVIADGMKRFMAVQPDVVIAVGGDQ